MVDQPSYPVLLVSLQGSMQEIPGHFLILVQPLDDEGLKPPGMARWDGALPSLVPLTLCSNSHYGLGGHSPTPLLHEALAASSLK